MADSHIQSSLDRRLRPEARPVEWSFLNESQKDVFRRVVYMMDEFARGSETSSQKDSGDDLFGAPIDESRTAGTVFLDGVRGVGKSTVFLSLMHYLRNTTNDPPPHGSERFKSAFKTLKNRTHWLEPIDMDPLPSPFALVPALIERVNWLVKKHVRSQEAKSNYRLETEDLLHEIRQFGNDATLAWDSNIEKRMSSLDPDYYGEEMRRTIQSRQLLSFRFDDLLGKIAKQFSSNDNAIFVATIDDFDMHPTACLHALKMLRMLSTKKMFFLLLGDFKILEMMSDLNVVKEISNLVPKTIKLAAVESEYINQIGSSIISGCVTKIATYGTAHEDSTTDDFGRNGALPPFSR